MTINFGLAGEPVNGLEALRYYGQAQMDQLQQAQIRDTMADRQLKNQQRQQVMAARPQITQQITAGDFGGARQTAAAAGDFDYLPHIKGLEESKRSQLAQEAELLGRTAFALKRVPPEQRAATLATLAPQLKATGYFSDEEIAAASQDLSDGVLDGYISTATTLKDQMDAFAKANEPKVLGRGDELWAGGARIGANTQGPAPDYVLDQESGDWLLKPGTGGAGYAAPSGGAQAGFSNGAPQQAVAQTLTQAGLPAPVVAGFLGNFHAEGGYGGARGDGGTAAGIAQWRGERQQNFRRVIGKDVGQASPEEQARFVLWELQNPRAAGMTEQQRDAIVSARTPEQAAALIDQHYERSSGEHRGRRVAAANSAFSAMGGSAPAPQAGGGTPTRVPSGRGPKRQQAPSGYEYGAGGGLQPVRGGPSDPRAPGEAMKSETTLRKEFDDQAAAKDFKIVRPAYKTLEQLANRQNQRIRQGQDASAADDMAIIFSYMKILDPNSVVRETEYATAKNAAGIPDQIRNLYNKAKNGSFLTADQRKQFISAAQQGYQERRSAYNEQADRYRELGREYGVNENRIAPYYLTPEETRQRQQQRGGGNDAARLRQKYGLR
jgi:hypothetical protein